jgi:hypothetical protein
VGRLGSEAVDVHSWRNFAIAEAPLKLVLMENPGQG